MYVLWAGSVQSFLACHTKALLRSNQLVIAFALQGAIG